MLDIGFYMRFHDLIKSLDENKEYTADEMYEKLEAIRSKDPVVYNIETTNRCNMRCKMCPRTTMMTRSNEDINSLFRTKADEAYLIGENQSPLGAYLDIPGISTHSFRKYYATEIYRNNGYNIALVQHLLQHSSAAVTQRYIGIQQREIETAIEKHLCLDI